MADTNFVPGTVVTSEWLNEVNDTIHSPLSQTFDDDTLGFLVVKNTSNGYNALRGFSKVEQELIQSGASAADHASVLDVMLSTEKHLYLPRGTWRRSTKWSVTNGMHIEGAGAGLTVVTATADVEAMELTGEFVKVHGLTLNKTGTHTKNLLNIGTVAGSLADRAHLHDLIVTGAGQDGIVLYAGNSGTLSSIRTRSNGRDGLRFDRPVSPDNHAWTLAGFIDASNNGRDGVRFDDGISLSDAYASKTHSGGTIIAQSNAGWGVYIGSTRNNLSIYAESNAAGNVYVGEFASGNRIAILEGVVVGNVGGVAGSLDGNEVIQLNHNANFRAGFKSRLELSGGSGKGYRIAGDDGTAGFLDVEKTTSREARTKYSGSSGVWNHYHEHTTPGTEAAQRFGGRLFPIGDNLWDIGASTLRWLMGHFNQIRFWGAPSGAANSLTIGYQVSGSATAGASGALPANPAGYIVMYVGTTQVKVPYYNA